MFEESAKLYFQLKCNVGGGSHNVKGKLYGMGCLLNETHVLTAWHIWREIQQKYMWPDPDHLEVLADAHALQ